MRRGVGVLVCGLTLGTSVAIGASAVHAAPVQVELRTGWTVDGSTAPPDSSRVSLITPQNTLAAERIWSGVSEFVEVEPGIYRLSGHVSRLEYDANNVRRGEDRYQLERNITITDAATIDLSVSSVDVEFRVMDADGQPVEAFGVYFTAQGPGWGLGDIQNMYTYEEAINGVAIEQLPLGLIHNPAWGPTGRIMFPDRPELPFTIPSITSAGQTVVIDIPPTAVLSGQTGWATGNGVVAPQSADISVRGPVLNYGVVRQADGSFSGVVDDNQTYQVDGAFKTYVPGSIARWDTNDLVAFRRTITVNGDTSVDLTVPTVDITFDVRDTLGRPVPAFDIEIEATPDNTTGLPQGITIFRAFHAGSDGIGTERLPNGLAQRPDSGPIGQLVLPGPQIIRFNLPPITEAGQVVPLTVAAFVDTTVNTGRITSNGTELPDRATVQAYDRLERLVDTDTTPGTAVLSPLEYGTRHRFTASVEYDETPSISSAPTFDRYRSERTLDVAEASVIDFTVPTVDVNFTVVDGDDQPVDQFEITLDATPATVLGLPAAVTQWSSFEAAVGGTATEQLPLGFASRPNTAAVGRLRLANGDVFNFNLPVVTTAGQTIELDLGLLADSAAPIVTPTLTPAPTEWGWNNTPVTVDWTVVDPAPSSGGNFNPQSVQVTEPGGNQVVTSGPWCDNAGNCTTGTVNVSIDTAPPTAYPPIFRPVGISGHPFIGVTQVYVDTVVNMFMPASDTPSGQSWDVVNESGFGGGEWFIGEDPGVGNANPTGLAMYMMSWVVRPPAPINVGSTPGTFTFGGRARDRAGNWSETVTGTLIVLPDPDTDGVSGSVENGAPNGGDGNGDGTLDSQQNNVTSLPAPNGTFVTLAAPTDATLNQVSVIDPTPLSPPSALTLPAGLASFELGGVPTGQDVTLTIYTASTANVTGYAKYQNGVWSILPSDRVTIFPNRVEIRLTDGGIGDDDGIANGVVVDPGGIVIQTAPLDTTPPAVTGTASPAANPAGWNKGDVTITWTTDDETATAPAPTTVTAEGAAQAIVSEPSCDPAGNCATGTVTVSIDRTAPTVTVSRATDGTLSCTATDTLSGPTGTCTIGTPVEAPANTFTVTATAVDTAGNTGTGTLTYTVTPVLTDRATVQSWITQLNALTLTGRNATARRNAVDDLRDAADSDNWRSNGQVRSDETEDVLEAFTDAAREIAKISGTPVPAQINLAMASMARRWATDAIATAPSRGVRANRIAQAQQALTQGDQHLAGSRIPQAIDAYTRAHERATDD